MPRLLSRALEGRRTCVGYDEADNGGYDASLRERDVGFSRRVETRNDVIAANFIVGLSIILALRDPFTISSGNIRNVSMFIGNIPWLVIDLCVAMDRYRVIKIIALFTVYLDDLDNRVSI